MYVKCVLFFSIPNAPVEIVDIYLGIQTRLAASSMVIVTCVLFIKNPMTKAAIKLVLLFWIFLALSYVVAGSKAFSQNNPQSLKASLARLSGYIESEESGPFVDLVKKLASYTDQTIQIEVYPYPRSIYNILSDKADFHIPSIRTRNPQITDPRIRYVDEPFGKVSFVIYSRTDNKITRDKILDAKESDALFRYTFEGPAYIEKEHGIPCMETHDIRKSLEKVAAKKIDGLIWPQEAADHELIDLGFKNIHREHWDDYDSVIIVPNTPRGERANAILSSAIKSMKQNGEMNAYYSKVHHPYKAWQPKNDYKDFPSNKLKASVAILPGLSEPPLKGPFIEFLHALEPYIGLNLEIELYPFSRSIENVINERADFHLPVSIDRSRIPPDLPYNHISEKMGVLAEIIYSHKDAPITKQMIIDAMAHPEKFPYIIEASSSFGRAAGFPYIASNSPNLSLEKIKRKRIDAFFWAQEEADAYIRKNHKNMIHRELWGYLDDTLIVAKTPHGDKVDQILSSAIKKLRESGKLEPLYSKIHLPFDPWQPADMTQTGKNSKNNNHKTNNGP